MRTMTLRLRWFIIRCGSAAWSICRAMKFIYTTESEVLGNTQIQDTWTYTNGYTDGAKMFSDLVTANRTDYSYEVSEGLKAFGE